MIGAAGDRVRPGRSRSLGWMSVVLLVLLATAALPAAGRGGATPERAAACVAVHAREAAGAFAGEVGRPRPAAGTAALAVPRPVPRTRQVGTRGLPPPRAPTA